MNKLIGAAVVAALFVPQMAAAAEKSGVVKNWFAGIRNVILADNTECVLGADIKEVPAALAVGKVNHQGDAIAVVIAETQAQGRDAAEKVKVD